MVFESAVRTNPTEKRSQQLSLESARWVIPFRQIVREARVLKGAQTKGLVQGMWAARVGDKAEFRGTG